MTENANVLLVNRAIIEDDNRVLILRRALDDSRNPGLWEFPGGKVDSGEELHDGLVREVREETGLTVEARKLNVYVETELIATGKYKDHLYLSLFHACRILEGELTLSHEHDDVAWVETHDDVQQELTIESRLALAALRSLR